MLRLNAGFSRKVGEANYGSRGASVNVELELESSLIGDAEALSNKIRRLFDLARTSVEHELSNGTHPRERQQPSENGRPGNGRRNGDARSATTSQVRAIRAICSRLDKDAGQLANGRFGVANLEELTLREASSLIDELKAGNNTGRDGGRA